MDIGVVYYVDVWDAKSVLDSDTGDAGGCINVGSLNGICIISEKLLIN